MGRDEAVYGDGHIYRPERWIPSSDEGAVDEEVRVRDIKKNFHPFLLGPGHCAGRSIALQELLLVCARAVWKTDLRLAPGCTNGEGKPDLGSGQRSTNQYIVKDSFLCLKDGPVLQFKPRCNK
jgi:cytochrome P450